MTERTYKAKVVMLRKTKLRDNDFILTMLAENGSQLRAVAKGARKPHSQFRSRCEPATVAEVFCARGRGLDIITEIRVESTNQRIRDDLALSACASLMIELVTKITHEDVPVDRLYPMTCAALEALASSDDRHALALSCAFMLKALAFVGLRPSLDACVSCGNVLDIDDGQDVALSVSEGGVVCEDCRRTLETTTYDGAIIRWIAVLLTSTFDDIKSFDIDVGTSFAILDFIQQWVRFHVGSRMKSIQFVFDCGLFV